MRNAASAMAARRVPFPASDCQTAYSLTKACHHNQTSSSLTITI